MIYYLGLGWILCALMMAWFILKAPRMDDQDWD